MFSCRLDVPSFIRSMFSDLNNSGEQHVFCYFNVECEFDARQRGANQRLDVRAPLLALRPPSSSLRVPQPQHSQYGGMGRVDISFRDRDRAGRHLDSSKRLMVQKAPARSLGLLVDDRCIDTGYFNSATSSTSSCSLAGNPCRNSHEAASLS